MIVVSEPVEELQDVQKIAVLQAELLVELLDDGCCLFALDLILFEHPRE